MIGRSSRMQPDRQTGHGAGPQTRTGYVDGAASSAPALAMGHVRRRPGERSLELRPALALALRCGWPPGIAWMLAVTLDAYAVDSDQAMAARWNQQEAASLAGGLVWAWLRVSLGGNATEPRPDHGLPDDPDGRPQWWIVVIVGTVPTIMLASLIHLEAMARSAQAGESADPAAEETAETTKRGRLVVLLEDTVPPNESESNYKVGQRLGPTVGLNVQTASRYVREWREARASVAKLGGGREAVS